MQNDAGLQQLDCGEFGEIDDATNDTQHEHPTACPFRRGSCCVAFAEKNRAPSPIHSMQLNKK